MQFEDLKKKISNQSIPNPILYFALASLGALNSVSKLRAHFKEKGELFGKYR